MRTRQQGIPGGQGRQMMVNLAVRFGAAYRRRSTNDNCQVSPPNNFINLLEVVRYLPKPHNACKYFNYRQHT